MIFAKHPGVAHCFVEQLEGHPLTPFLSTTAASVRVPRGTLVSTHQRGSLCETISNRGWREAGGSTRLHHGWNGSSVTPQARAFVRSQSGPGGIMALTNAPTSVLTKIPPHLFRVVLLRRLYLPLAVPACVQVWPSNRSVCPP